MLKNKVDRGLAKSKSRKAEVSRRGLLHWGFGAAFFGGLLQGRKAAVAASVPMSEGTGEEAKRVAEMLMLRVEDAHITLTPSPRAPGVCSFLTIGDIVQYAGRPASGKYFAKGVITDEEALADFGFVVPQLAPGTPDGDGFSFVDHRFRIDGRGSILGHGAELDAAGEPLAITGGTGEFVGSYGTYTIVGGPIPLLNGRLDVTFHLWRR